MSVQSCDTAVGNIIVDDDGSSTTVFWTLALGALDNKGIIVIPDGYTAGVIEAFNISQEDSGSGNNLVKIFVGDRRSSINRYASLSNSIDHRRGPAMAEHSNPKIQYQRMGGAIADIFIHMMYIIW